MLCLCTSALAATSLPVQTFPGNDVNDYTPPDGFIHYQIPNSSIEGSHTISFDNDGSIVSQGPYSFTVMIGSLPGNSYTQILTWISNFSIYAVIVNGDGAFNLYQYDPSFRADTDLVAPDGPLGDPDNVSHVSLVINPDALQIDQAATLPTGLQTTILIINTIFQIISTILLGLLVFLMYLLLFGSTFNIFGSCIRKFHKKSHEDKKPQCHDKDKDCDKKEDKDCDHKEDKDCDNKDHNDYCKEKHDPSKGYSLDCNHRNDFPYNNYYNRHL